MTQEQYLEDASGYRGRAEQVMAPGSEQELAACLRRAHRERIPVTVAGGGTGVTGGRCPHGGWVLSMEKFRRCELGRGRARVGSGLLLRELQAAARGTGQLYGPDPTETAAMIGGTVATNASGARSFRYGDTRRHVLGLRVALADGTILELERGALPPFPIPEIPAPATTKHAAGYWLRAGMDYVDLFIGSEGTLGIVLEAELRLLPAPAHLLSGVIFFAEDAEALEAVESWRPLAGLRMLEYLDAGSLELLRPRYPEIPERATAALLIEQELERDDGMELDAWMTRLAAAGALEEACWFAVTAAERERLRRFRHALPEAVNQLMRRNGFLKLGSDCAVPLARNREMMAYYRKRLEAEFAGHYVVFGHIGDAHVHVNILAASGADYERGRQMMLDFARQAVALGGTVSAEHGLGKRKAHLLGLQYEPRHIESMKQIKRRLDPLWLLGRDTLFPYCEVE